MADVIKHYIDKMMKKCGLWTYVSVHFRCSESLANSNGSSGSLFESNTLKSFMHVQSVISSSVLQLLLSFPFGTRHPNLIN